MTHLKVFSLLILLIVNRAMASIGLSESFQSALKNNQIERINESRISQKSEARNKLEGNYLPSLAGKGTFLKQDKSDSATAIGLNLNHTLYKGGQDYQSVQIARTSQEIAENQKVVDRQNLYAQVVSVYYNFVTYLNDMDNLNLLKKQSLERVDEIRKRVQIGRSRRGELMQAEAQLASVDAQVLNGQGLLSESQERFYLLTGLEKNESIAYKKEIQTELEVDNLDRYLSKALEREDVKNKKLAIDLSDKDITFSKGYHLPKLDLSSNYYFNKTGGTLASRNSDWDLSLVLTLPLFEGGASQARIRESVEKKQEAIYLLTDYEKAVKIDITSKYETYKRYLNQIKAYDQALLKGKSSYDETLRDYRLGLVSNLDVLTSLNLYLDSKRNAERNRIQAMMTKKLLEASAGVLP